MQQQLEHFEHSDHLSVHPSLFADYLGADTILWATDYPHLDGFWGAAKMIKKMGMPPATEAAVLAGGAKRLYNLH